MKSEIKCKYCGNEYECTEYGDERGVLERHQHCLQCGHVSILEYGRNIDNTEWYEDALKYRSQETEWISVEERLPEINEEVYTCSTKIRGWVPRFAHYLGENTFGDRNCIYYVDYNEVTHWRPLPQPPKGE